jgi:hypothetical protein
LNHWIPLGATIFLSTLNLLFKSFSIYSCSLRQLLLNLEKKVARNQQQRAKHYDEPSKFMDSEIELHAAISDLTTVAASPELYPILVESNSVKTILGMITHENTDISLASVSLLDELIDASVLADVPEARPFIDAVLDLQGLELLVQNLNRLDESSEEDAQGVCFASVTCNFYPCEFTVVIYTQLNKVLFDCVIIPVYSLYILSCI